VDLFHACANFGIGLGSFSLNGLSHPSWVELGSACVSGLVDPVFANGLGEYAEGGLVGFERPPVSRTVLVG
jgi:hypothetical protein